MLGNIRELSDAYSFWTNISQWLIGITALVTLLYFGASYRALKKAGELKTAQDAQSKTKDDELATDLKNKDLSIATADQKAADAGKETARLTKEAEQAKAEQANANKQIEIAKADSAKASVEVAGLQVTVAKAEQRRAEAEKALLELQERVKDRHLTAAQLKTLSDNLTNRPSGQLEIRCPVANPEARNLALEFVQLFTSSGWQVTLNDRVMMTPAPVGLKLWTHTDGPIMAL